MWKFNLCFARFLANLFNNNDGCWKIHARLKKVYSSRACKRFKKCFEKVTEVWIKGTRNIFSNIYRKLSTILSKIIKKIQKIPNFFKKTTIFEKFRQFLEISDNLTKIQAIFRKLCFSTWSQKSFIFLRLCNLLTRKIALLFFHLNGRE